MIAFAVAVFWADGLLDRQTLSGFWTSLFPDRTYPPSGMVLAAVTLAVLIPLAARELAALIRTGNMQCHAGMITLSAVAGCLTVYAMPQGLKGSTGVAIIATVLVLAFAATLLWHAHQAGVSGSIAAAGATMFAVVLLGLMPGFYLAMRRWHSPWVVMAVLLIVKSCDIGAFFTGRSIGRHKLIPWLSPGKTWEGLFCGMLTSALVALVFAVAGWVHITWWQGLIFGLVIGPIGQAGDLLESLMKRDAEVKDSGHWIPGFGGILDVIDSPLFAAPFAYLLFSVF